MSMAEIIPKVCKVLNVMTLGPGVDGWSPAVSYEGSLSRTAPESATAHEFMVVFSCRCHSLCWQTPSNAFAGCGNYTYTANAIWPACRSSSPKLVS